MKDSPIQWTGPTWNPWHGCRKVSAGCKFCYMFRDKERYGQEPTKVMRSKTKFYEPLKHKDPKLIFTCSWSDWFIEDADEWRKEAWQIIKNTPHHTYQILTKRPERIIDNLPEDWGIGYPNVWIGVSIENNDNLYRLAYFDLFPAKVKFVSFEPLLELIDISTLIACSSKAKAKRTGEINFDWAIIGGESGNDTGKYRYRPCEFFWIGVLIGFLIFKHIPVFMKQTGTYLAKLHGYKDRHGGDPSEWPVLARIRQMPKGFKR